MNGRETAKSKLCIAVLVRKFFVNELMLVVGYDKARELCKLTKPLSL